VERSSADELVRQFNAERRGAVAKHTWNTDEANLRLHFLPAFKTQDLAGLKPGKLAAHWSKLLRGGKSRGTVSRIRNSVSSLYSWAELHDLVEDNPVKRAKLPKGDGQEKKTAHPFTDGELATALARLAATGGMFADAAELLVLTGLRFGELAALRVGSVVAIPLPSLSVTRSKTESYNEKNTKSGRARRVPLEKRAQEIVAKHSTGKGADELLFMGARGGQLRASNFRRNSGWARAAPGHRIHDLRHTAATTWLQSGIDVKTVSIWLGHSDPVVTLRVYAHWMDSAADIAGLEKLERRHERSGAQVIQIGA
jgi:integrase